MTEMLAETLAKLERAEQTWEICELLEALGGHGGGREAGLLVPTLARHLDADATAVRVAAAKALGRCEGAASDAVQPLAARLAVATESWERTACIEALASLAGSYRGPELVDAIVPHLEAPEPGVQMDAARALGACRDLRAAPALERLLADTSARGARQDAVQALGAMRAVQTVPRLLELLEVRDTFLEAACIEALGAMGEPIAVPALLRHTKRYPRRVTNALVSIGSPRAIIEALGQPRVPLSGRVSAVQALGKLGSASAIAPLVKRLGGRSSITLQTAAARALVELGWQPEVGSRAHRLTLLAMIRMDELVALGEPARPTLERALRHADWRMQCHAAWSLGRLGGRGSLEALLGALERSKGDAAAVGAAAARALGQVGAVEAVGPLLASLWERRAKQDPDHRKAVIQALAQIRDVRAIGPLVMLAHNGDVVAIEALAAWSSPAVVEPLRALLRGADLAARRAAAASLEAIGVGPGSSAERVAELIAGQRWEDLQMMEAATEPLIEALGTQPPELQPALAQVLGRRGELVAAPAVLAWLFAHPTLLDAPATREQWVRALRPLFGELCELALDAACYARMDTEVLEDNPDHDVLEERYTYDLDAAERATRTLAESSGPVAINLLHEVARKANARVEVTYSQNEWAGGATRGTLSFKAQRAIARDALTRRSAAKYEPQAYLDRQSWRLVQGPPRAAS